jgi:endonuclease/exonuclease/phosphatase family metal-dependent hydrolase
MDTPVLVDSENAHARESAAIKIQYATRRRLPRVAKKVFKDRNALRIISFNSLKLRTQRVGLELQFLELVEVMSTQDVVLVQEVPAEPSVKDVTKTRAHGLKLLLEQANGKQKWDIVLSDPSGPGNLEVHVALVRAPVKVLEIATHTIAAGVPLDHSPLSIKIYDPRMAREEDRTWVVTSVHLPPKTRAKTRDAQIKGFLKEYTRSADFRLGTPFTEKGAKDARTHTVHHIIGGDFNVWPDPEEFALAAQGFSPPVLGECVSTSAGSESYDNFIMSKHTFHRFALQSDVLELEMLKRPGADGLSDHNPVLLALKEVSPVKHKRRPKKAEPKEPAEPAEPAATVE